MIHGECDFQFLRVRDEFDRNFAERGELGASVCVVVDGAPVVDLWGGVADSHTGREWDRDTLNVVMSCSKGLTATCVNMLIDRGQIDLDTPVVQYWPGFGQRGKSAITVRQVLTHQSGVAHVQQTIRSGGLYDWDRMTELIEGQTPLWKPGTRTGYHPFTFGFILGEVLRRVDGRTIGTFFRQEIAEPLGLDCWIGLPVEHEPRVAASIPFDYSTLDLGDLIEATPAPGSIRALVATNSGDWLATWDSRQAHAAELPASGAITNARGLAGHYAPLALDGSVGGVRLLTGDAASAFRYVHAATDVDAVLGIRTAYSVGYSKSWSNPPRHRLRIGEDAFGTSGLGGQVGFADPAYRLAFGYTMNRHAYGTGINERGQALVDSVYQALGSPTKRNGYWARPS
jgi:CubicO group peptidase (beta-lactamase class C family)